MAPDEKTYYVDEKVGEDTPSSEGTEEKPFKSVQFAYLQHGEAQYLIRDPDAPEGWKPATKSALKKAKNFADGEKKKAAKARELALRQKKEDEDREKVLEEAKKIVVEEDLSLPSKRISLWDKDQSLIGQRVRVFGRAHRVRKQAHMVFIELRDGYGYLQAILSGNLAKSYGAQTLTLESSLEIVGTLRKVPEGAHAPDGRELEADFYRVLGLAPGGDHAIQSRISKNTDPSILLDLRHLTLRGETASSIMIVRDAVEHAFNLAYHELKFRKSSVEGGATLFELNYYNETVYLTQSSQLYLETCLPSMGNVYCIEKSFRAEKSLTRRHLSEFCHVEAELDFITFEDLLEHIETLLCRVLEITLADQVTKGIITTLNPKFSLPKRPFRRLHYDDAIKWLNEHGIKKEDGSDHVFGDDIAEAAERKMIDEIGEFTYLHSFPADLKAFYMKKDPNDPRLTESVDLCVPTVGEIVGGSMRISDYDELMAAFEKNHLSPEPYEFYIDQRRKLNADLSIDSEVLTTAGMGWAWIGSSVGYVVFIRFVTQFSIPASIPGRGLE